MACYGWEIISWTQQTFLFCCTGTCTVQVVPSCSVLLSMSDDVSRSQHRLLSVPICTSCTRLKSSVEYMTVPNNKCGGAKVHCTERTHQRWRSYFSSSVSDPFDEQCLKENPPCGHSTPSLQLRHNGILTSPECAPAIPLPHTTCHMEHDRMIGRL